MRYSNRENQVKISAYSNKKIMGVVGCSFDEALLNGLTLIRPTRWATGDERAILKQMESKTLSEQIDHAYCLFRDNMCLCVEFAKSVRIGDTIHPTAFNTRNKIGESIRSVIWFQDIVFILFRRTFYTESHMFLELIACHEDYDYTVIEKVMSGRGITH